MRLDFDLAEIFRAQTTTLTLLRGALGLTAALEGDAPPTAPREQPKRSCDDQKGSKTDASSTPRT